MRLRRRSDISRHFPLRRLPLRCLAAAVLAALMGAALSSCNTSGCTDNHSALPLLGIYDYNDGASATLDSISFIGVGAPGDSMLVSPGQRVHQIYLPLRVDDRSCSFTIHYDYKLMGLDSPRFDDRITLDYVAEPYFASAQCGAMYRYRITSVSHTSHILRDVVISDSIIDNVERERIHLYFDMEIIHPTEPEEGEEDAQ